MSGYLHIPPTQKMLKIQKEYETMLTKLDKLPDKKASYPNDLLHLPEMFYFGEQKEQENKLLSIYKKCLKDQITWQEYYQKTAPDMLSSDIIFF